MEKASNCRRLEVFGSAGMTSLGLAIVIVIASAASALSQGKRQDPPGGWRFPGTLTGRTESRWIAPFTRTSSFSVGQHRHTTVRWFSEDGEVIKTLSGSGVEGRSDYVRERSGRGQTLHDVRGKWNVVLPEKRGSSSTLVGGGDAILHQFPITEEQIAVDVYHSGKKATTAGPFFQYKRRDVSLAGNGVWSLITWQSERRAELQVVVGRSDGSLKVFPGCGPDDRYPFPVGGGQRVLVEVTNRKESPVLFRYSKGGKVWADLEMGPNAHPLVDLEDGSLVLFRTSIGRLERFVLVDCDSGKVEWDIPAPTEYFPGSATNAFPYQGQFLFAGRDLAAVDIRSGRLVGRWKGSRLRDEPGQFAEYNDKLYLFTSQNVIEIDPLHIREGRNGWERSKH